MTESYYDRNIGKQIMGNLGMFLVCAELSKHKLIAMPTSMNTEGCDIVVLNPKTGRTASIQVKCSVQADKGGFPTISSTWTDYNQKVEERISADFFVFVDISNPDKPNYFIVSKNEVKALLRSRIEQYLQRYRQKHTREQMLQREKSKSAPWTIKLISIKRNEYEKRWDTITNSLQRPTD